jgi:hypothetical protein
MTDSSPKPIGDKTSELETSANLRPVHKIFDRSFSGVYYNDKANLFYGIHIASRMRTFPYQIGCY